MSIEQKPTSCFICGALSCKQATDHKRMSFQEFDELLKTKAGYHPMIAKLKIKIGKFYDTLAKLSELNLNQYVIDLFLMIDKLHFWHLLRFTTSLRDIETLIFGIALPKSKVMKVLELLEQERDPYENFPKFEALLSEVHKFKKSTPKIIENGVYDELIFRLAAIIQQCEDHLNQEKQEQKSSRKGSIQTNCSQDDPGMPNNQVFDSEVVMIEGVPFSTRRRSLDLSIFQFTDATFLNSYTSLKKMKDVVDLQIRNSRLSQRSYRMLLRQFPKLETLDLSSSTCQSSLPSITKLTPNLKTLYLNQTSLTNENLLHSLPQLTKLKVLYVDYNLLTGECLEQLHRKRKGLIHVSAKGNLFDQAVGNRLQANMVLRGGYLEF